MSTRSAIVRARVRRQLALMVVAAALAVAGCEDCVCRRAIEAVPREWYESPPDDVIARIVGTRMAQEGALASTACGRETAGLTDVTVTPKKISVKVAGQGLVRVTGTAIGVTPKLVCTAVVSYLIFTHRDVKDGPATYALQGDLSLYAVETPGVTWVRPSSGGGHSFDD